MKTLQTQILKKIFSARRSPTQVFLASVGLLLGMLLLLFSLQLYIQIQRLLNPENTNPEYLVLSKKINLGNTLLLSRAEFKESEVEALKSKAFTTDLGKFTANQFEVAAFLSGSISFSSELFFESVPSQFLDFQPEDWDWSEQSEFLPIVLSQDMLNLYNFGFALSKGFPQISASTISRINIKVRLRGINGQRIMDAKIVGFTERISSILVPQSFMEWANQNIGENKSVPPSRLIIKVKNPADPELVDYLSSQNYQINQDRLNAGKAAAVVQVVMSIVGLVGLLFIGLALVIFTMNFRVILAEAKNEIQLLLHLGYTAAMIGNYLIRYFARLILGVSVVSLVLLYVAQYFTQNFLADKGIAISEGVEPLVWLVALLLISLMFTFNISFLQNSLKKYAL